MQGLKCKYKGLGMVETKGFIYFGGGPLVLLSSPPLPPVGAKTLVFYCAYGMSTSTKMDKNNMLLHSSYKTVV